MLLTMALPTGSACAWGGVQKVNRLAPPRLQLHPSDRAVPLYVCTAARYKPNPTHFNGDKLMAKLVALYKKPANAAAFDDYYFSNHVPKAKKLPGLRRYEVSTGPVGTPQGDSAYHLVAVLAFDSMAALQSGLGSPEGQATAGDLANFAQAGVELLVFDSKEV
jgi:uncharacterized protein (TIGR02118 family)